MSYKTGLSAADDLLTTVEDLCSLGVSVMNKQGLSPELYIDMVTPQVKINEHVSRGLGWTVVNGLPNGEYALEHGGSDIGAKASMVLFPKSKRGIVILTNADNGARLHRLIIKESLDIGNDFMEIVSPTPILDRPVVDVSEQTLNEYAGTYLQPTGRVMEIAKDGKILNISGSGCPLIDLYPEAQNKFFGTEYKVQIVFEKDKASNAIKATLFEDGSQIMVLTKK